ncbi:hypothetical protein E2C01_093688 [Portunus trituberculatus]|uniref:Uncharacterized protein n=1 Tax=Portunus trituberculatus TaxID=210409 RepID=A0A5B7JQG5_PORTR|nr:hypothetical protein [Portunus trituberculatus]
MQYRVPEAYRRVSSAQARRYNMTR